MRLLTTPFSRFATTAVLASLMWSRAHAQAVSNAAPAATTTGLDYAAESFVIERLDSIYAMNADGTGFQEQATAIKVQSDAALKEFGVLNLPFASATGRVEIEYARVRHPDGSVVETPVGDALEQPEAVTQAAPFYSDLKRKQLPIRSLKVGDTLEWKARVVHTKAEAPGQFWGQWTFAEGQVALEETVELRVPKAVKVTIWNNPGLKLKPDHSTDGESDVYRWSRPQRKPTAGAEAEADKKKKEKTPLTPEEELDEREGRLPDVAWTTFPNWEAVGAWYRGLEGERMLPDAELKAKVAELTAGKTTEEEKVKAVYGFVSSQVRYIGVAFGVGRYQPHRASEVMDNQYGDCKDKHTLLAAMLTTLGFHPDAVLIGAQIRFNDAVPSPAAFNHLITRVAVGGQEVWLDTTAEVAPYRVLSSPIRDQQALVVPDSGPAKLERTPKDLPFASLDRMRVVGTLTPDGVESSTVEMTLRGDTELIYRAVLRQVPPAQYDAFAQQMWSRLGFSGETAHAEIGSMQDTDHPLTIKYPYKREQAGGKWSEDTIVAQLIPDGLPLVDEKEPPTRSIELGTPRTEMGDFELKLPEGWTAELPPEVHAKTVYASYDQSYRLEKGTLCVERRVTVSQPRVPQAEWKSYKKWQDEAGAGGFPYIHLVRPGASASTTVVADARRSDSEAGRLIAEAVKALDAHDVETASPLLDRAKDANSQEKGLWAALGYMSLQRGESKTAMHDYAMELEFHADSYAAYEQLARLEGAAGRRAEQKATLKTWIGKEPANPKARAALIVAYVDAGEIDAALTLGESTLKSVPEDQITDEALLFMLGRSQMKAGKVAEGSKSLTEMLKTAQNPRLVSAACDLLTASGRTWPGAVSAELEILERLSKPARVPTTGPALKAWAEVRQHNGEVYATWASLGRALMQEGKLDEAERYLQAAWLSSQWTTAGEALGDLKERRGEMSAALTLYRQAMAGGGQYDPFELWRTSDEEQKLLQAKINRAIKAGGRNLSSNALMELQQMRTVPMGAANGRQGVAEYVLHLRGGAVEEVEAQGAKKVEGGQELAGKAKLTKFFPAESNAPIVREAMLNCHSGVCELVLEP